MKTALISMTLQMKDSVEAEGIKFKNYQLRNMLEVMNMLENDVVVLKPLDNSKDDFITGINDENLCQMYGLSYPADGEKLFRRFVKMNKVYGIFRKVDECLCGFIVCVDPELPEHTLEQLPSRGKTLAYATFPAYQRQGYMYSALSMLIADLFEREEADFIHCGIHETNIPSAQLLKKSGFVVLSKHEFNGQIIVDEILHKENESQE